MHFCEVGRTRGKRRYVRCYGYGYCSHASRWTQYLWWREVYPRPFCRFNGNGTNGFICICHIYLARRARTALRFLDSIHNGRALLAACCWYPIKRDGIHARRAHCHCSSRGAAWRLCKCCSRRRNRCLSPDYRTSGPSFAASGYAYAP